MTWKPFSVPAKVTVNPHQPNLPHPRLMAISHGLSSGGKGFHRWLEALGDAGVDCLQLREKHLSDRRLFELTQLTRRCLPSPVKLLVNGRLDIALAAGADGVHLPSDGPPTDALRKRFGDAVILGRSTHQLDEVERETRHGASFVTFGPIYPTPSKPGHRDLPGLSGLHRAAQVGIPVLALGGIDDSHLEAIRSAGASGIAAIRLFQTKPGLAPMVRRAKALFAASPAQGY